MIPTGEVYLHSDSGDRRLNFFEDDDVKGYGIRGANLLRRGNHKLEVCYPTTVTLHELHAGPLTPTQLKNILEIGGLSFKVTLTIDAESVFKSLSSKDLKKPTECTLLGHISWIRQMMERGIVHCVQWCDTLDMSADGHTKGSIDRDLLYQVMEGIQAFKYDLKKHVPFRAAQTNKDESEPPASAAGKPAEGSSRSLVVFTALSTVASCVSPNPC